MYYDACNSDYQKPMLQGLLLRLQAGGKGRYQRVGVFAVSEQWNNGKHEVFTFRATKEVMGGLAC
jgi:hypothetical protein